MALCPYQRWALRHHRTTELGLKISWAQNYICFFPNWLAMQPETLSFNHILFSEVSFYEGHELGKRYQWSKDSIDERVKAAQEKNWKKIGGTYVGGPTKNFMK